MELSGKNVVIVGGYGGIGFELSQMLLHKDVANLIVLDKCENSSAHATLKELKSFTGVYFIAYDVTMMMKEMKDIFKRIVEKVKTIDVLIYAAGVAKDNMPSVTIHVNFTGLVNTVMAVFEFLDKRHGNNGGVIVPLSSVAGLDPFPALPVYSATKSAVISFVRSLAQEEPITGVTLFAICPGVTDTPMLGEVHTFLDLDTHLNDKLTTQYSQSPEMCAKNIIKILEACQNNSVWMIDNGHRKEVKFSSYWQAPKELL